jgi:hypothetical protein
MGTDIYLSTFFLDLPFGFNLKNLLSCPSSLFIKLSIPRYQLVLVFFLIPFISSGLSVLSIHSFHSFMCQGTVLCHTSGIYISIIKSVQTNKKINLFYFFYFLFFGIVYFVFISYYILSMIFRQKKTE